MEQVDPGHFAQIDLRTGTIVAAEPFPEARKPAIKIWADFGSDLGIRQSSAQITARYAPADLVGKQIVGCVNLGTKKIAGFNSEFLLTGFADEAGSIVLAVPERKVPNGARLL